MSSTIDNKSQQTLIIQSLLSRINNNSTNTGTRVTEWSDTPLDTNYPSEKLVKDTIDNLDLTGGGSGDKNVYDENETGKTFYINYTSGSDDNDGTSTTTAFKTIEKAWSEIPILFTKTYTIKFIGNYSSEINLSKKIGIDSTSSITITSNNTSSLSIIKANFNMNGFETNINTNGLRIESLKFYNSTLCLNNVNYLKIDNSHFDESGASNYGIRIKDSEVHIESSFISSSTSTYALLYAYQFSNVLSKGNTYSTGKRGIYVNNNSNATSSNDTYTNIITKVSKDNTSTYILIE